MSEPEKKSLRPLLDKVALGTALAKKEKAEAERDMARQKLARSSLRAASAEVGGAAKAEPKKRRHGNSKYTPEKGRRVLEALAAGKSLRAASAEVGVDPATLLLWEKNEKEFSQQYALAREIGWKVLADDIESVLRKAHEAALDPECGTARIAACRLEIDTKKWMLTKMLPKVYGDRTQMEISGPNGEAFLPKHTLEEDERFARLTAAALAKIQAEEAKHDEKPDEE